MATIQKRGKYWRAQVRRIGVPSQSASFDTRREAEAWATEQEAQIRRGQFVDRRAAERTTLGEVIDGYIERIAPTHKGGDAEIPRLRRFKRDERELCQYAMARLTPELFEGWRDRRLAAVSAGSVKREFNLLNSVIESCRRRLKLADNPLKDVDRPRVDDEREIRLTADEWRRLIAECWKEPMRGGPWKPGRDGKKARPLSPWLAPAVELARETGARRSELLRWRWEDTDLTRSTAVFRDVKNSRNPEERIDRHVGLSPRAVQILRKLPRSLDGRVIPLSPEALRQAFERARARASLPHFRLHDLRHELASSLTEAGWSPLEVMAQGGWRDPKSVKRYTNLSGRHLAARFRSRKSS